MLKLINEGTGEIFYATQSSAGFDISANEELELPPGEWKMIGTGLRIIEDSGTQILNLGSHDLNILPELQIRPRSGLAARNGVTVLNTPSTIDADYRGEIKIILINHSKTSFFIKRGDRIAQGVFALICHLPGVSVKSTERGTGGFGSTGV